MRCDHSPGRPETAHDAVAGSSGHPLAVEPYTYSSLRADRPFDTVRPCQLGIVNPHRSGRRSVSGGKSWA